LTAVDKCGYRGRRQEGNRRAGPAHRHHDRAAHWGAIVGADFFTTEVWTWRGLVTYETVFVIDLASRRVQILGSTPHPEALFMQQAVRTFTMADAGAIPPPRMLICDRDRKWSDDVRRRLRDAGIRIVLTPARAPNANAHAKNPRCSAPLSSLHPPTRLDFESFEVAVPRLAFDAHPRLRSRLTVSSAPPITAQCSPV
jgi:transposase InsO family protein